jgi:2-haloacid dehalogenase
MTATEIRDVDVCVFDAYGTLFDYASAAMRCKDALAADWMAVSELWRRKQLEYTWLRSLMGRHADFWHVTGESLDYALTAFKRQDPSLRALLMQQFLSLDCYGDVTAMLQRLREGGMKTAILSNGTPTMLTAAVNSAGIGRLLDGVYSVEKVGVFKPHPSVYQIVVDELGVSAGRVCFMSSNGWDAAGAAAFGFRTVWVNRGKLPVENLPAHPEAMLPSLADLPALLGL